MRKILTSLIIISLISLFLTSCGSGSQITGATVLDGTIQEEENLVVEIGNTETLSERNLDDALKTISEGFVEYDNKYEPNILLNAKTVTDSTLSRMKTQQDEIKEAVSTMQEAISQGAVNEQFEKEEYKIDTCLKSMKEYEEYMKLIAEMDDIDEQLDVKTDVLYNYVWAEEYNDAREHIDEVQPLIQEMIKNLEKRQATGIEKIPDDFIESWHDYHDAFNLLREFVDWWQERSYRYADDKYEEFSKAIAESLEADAERTWEQTIIEVDGWYENNIRLCVGVLE